MFRASTFNPRFPCGGPARTATEPLEGGSEGLLPETPNWAVGVSVTYPFSEKFSLKARRTIETQNAAVERAKYDQILQNLKGQSERARVALESAYKIAKNTPIQLSAARDSEMQARARYEALLAPLTELADAQRLLTQAEIDNSLARLNIWRALLFSAKAGGDLEPFLQLTEWVPVGEEY
jgi:outer membrane protein TolC